MRAAWYEKCGSASEVLIVGDMERPVPEANEVLVRVHASGINPSDVKMRAGARGDMAYPRVVPHSDGAGVVEEVGNGVPESRIGERVWGIRMAFHEHGVHARGHRGPGEQGRPVRTATALRRTRPGKLRRVRHIETDRASEIHEVAQTYKVVDQPVIAEEGPPLGEHGACGASLVELVHDVAHLGG